jgi:hypothetical protein
VHPIKTLGLQTINLKLKEGIPAHFTLNVIAEIAQELKPASE